MYRPPHRKNSRRPIPSRYSKPPVKKPSIIEPKDYSSGLTKLLRALNYKEPTPQVQPRAPSPPPAPRIRLVTPKERKEYMGTNRVPVERITHHKTPQKIIEEKDDELLAKADPKVVADYIAPVKPGEALFNKLVKKKKKKKLNKRVKKRLDKLKEIQENNVEHLPENISNVISRM